MPIAIALLLTVARSGSGYVNTNVFQAPDSKQSAQVADLQPPKAPPKSPVTREMRWQVIQEIDDVLKKKAFAIDLHPEKWLQVVVGYSADLAESTTPDTLSVTLTRAMQDMHSSHMAIVATKTMRHLKTMGTGLIPYQESGISVVWRVLRNSPAEKAGALSGDRILSSQNPTAADPHGKPAIFRLQTAGKPPRTVTVRPGPIEYDFPPQLVPINDKTAVLEVTTFTDNYVLKEMEDLIRKANKYDNLLIDLRLNGGGQPDRLLHFLSFFEAKGTPLGYFVSKADAEKFTAETGKQPTDAEALAKWSRKLEGLTVPASNVKYGGQIAILIGPATGSAAEICAESLREFRNAPAVGMPTAGAVLFPSAAYLPSGYLLEYPALEYVSYWGRRLENNPIKPDLAVEDAGIYGWPGHPDPIWKKALKLAGW